MPHHAEGRLAENTAGPGWSARPFSDTDRTTVLDFFTEPDFYFRTAQPDTRSEPEILDLITGETQVLLADGTPVGLYVLEENGSGHGCHYLLHLRLRATAPAKWWPAAYHEVVRGLRWRHEAVRVSVLIGEYDPRGIAAARTAGLTREGTLAKVTTHNGVRYGTVFFSQVWTPQS